MRERGKEGGGRGYDQHQSKLLALVMCPTRELALQVKEALISLSLPPPPLVVKNGTQFTLAPSNNDKQTVVAKPFVQVVALVGGLAAEKQERVLKKGPEVVVATPGRLWELVS